MKYWWPGCTILRSKFSAERLGVRLYIRGMGILGASLKTLLLNFTEVAVFMISFDLVFLLVAKFSYQLVAT